MGKFTLAFLLIFMSITGSATALHSQQEYDREKTQLLLDLYQIGVLDFSNFEVPNSPTSNYYVNLRNIISYPDVQRRLITLMEYKAEELSFQSICGVPYAAVPFASNLAYKMEKPLLMRRTNRKKYGYRKKVEGIIVPGSACLVVEDTLCGGTSAMETIEDLVAEGLNVTDCIVVFDRQQGGVEYCGGEGVKMHPLFTISDFMTVLEATGFINADFASAVLDWTRAHQMPGVN